MEIRKDSLSNEPFEHVIQTAFGGMIILGTASDFMFFHTLHVGNEVDMIDTPTAMFAEWNFILHRWQPN